jgi:fatty acid desaturase
VKTYRSLLGNPSLLEELITDVQQMVVIDEIQKIPELLDEVHRLIQKKKITFLLTGPSARKFRHGNILLSIIFTAFYAWICLLSPAFSLAFGATFIFAILISGLRPYLEHAGTTHERFQSSRTWISPLFDYLYSGINYHLAHHLSPGVPAYRIKEFHQWLLNNNYLPRNEIVQISTLKEALTVVRSMPYGSKDV